MDKNKEILELKKLYLIQVEKWEIRTFFISFSLAISLIVLAIQKIIPPLWGITILTVLCVFEGIFEKWRTKKFNELKREIEKGEFKDMRLKPDNNKRAI